MSEEIYVVMYSNGGFISSYAAYTNLNDARYMAKCLNKDPKITAWPLTIKLYSRNAEEECCGKCGGKESVCGRESL